ncbi:MAG: hypothetical protein U0746_20925 [Gemmataceae bacterium]
MSVGPNNGWVPCPDGELRRLSHRLHGRRRNRFGIHVTLVTAVMAATGIAASAVVDWSQTDRTARRAKFGTSVATVPECRATPEGGCDSKR